MEIVTKAVGLARMREGRGLSSQQLADAIGLDAEELARLESGEVSAPPKLRSVLMRYFNCGFEQLFEVSQVKRGVNPPDLTSLLGQSAVLWVTEGEGPSGGWSSLSQVPVLHYDFTATCQVAHSHVAWSATSNDTMVAIQAATKLVQPLLRPESEADRQAKLAALKRETGQMIIPDVNPDLWTCVPVLASVMWAAGCQGRGPRDAMEWLSAGQVKAVRDYCVNRARSTGHNIPLWGALDAVLASPDLPFAVSVAWRALAPFEEVMRRSPSAQSGLQVLDLDGWLATRKLLILTLPGQPTALQLSIPFALSGGATRGEVGPKLETIWQQVGGELVAWNLYSAPPRSGAMNQLAGQGISPTKDVAHATLAPGVDAALSSQRIDDLKSLFVSTEKGKDKGADSTGSKPRPQS